MQAVDNGVLQLLRNVSNKALSRMYSREGAKDYNVLKNRFQDILPCKCNNPIIVLTLIHSLTDDLTRVYLKSTGARGSDYINANYIDVSEV